MATNPLGSKAPDDFLVNVPNLDIAINADTAQYWIDRFGKQRYTWLGIETRANLQITRATDAATAAEAARDDAQAIAETLAAVRIYRSYALALADVPNLQDGENVEINIDETRDNLRTRYVVNAGALDYQVTLSVVLNVGTDGVNDAAEWLPVLKLVSVPASLATAINATNEALAKRTKSLQAAQGNFVAKTSSTGSIKLSAGTSAQRDSNPEPGWMRWNTDGKSAEIWTGTAWEAVGGSGGHLFQLEPHNGAIEKIPLGFIPANGQKWYASLYPDAAAALEAGAQFMVSDVTWNAADTYKGCWSSGGTDEGGRWYRAPKLNADTNYRAPFLRGSQIGVDAGKLVLDQMQGHWHEVKTDAGQTFTGYSNGGGGPGWGVGYGGTQIQARGVIADSVNGTPRVGDETRPRYHGVIMCIRMFGTVSNPGSLDAAQLATDLAVARAEISALKNDIGFTVIYPNGGTAAAPANVAINSRYVLTNPFPGCQVICEAEIKPTGLDWGPTGWVFATGGYGVTAAQYGSDIAVTTGSLYLTSTALRFMGEVWPTNPGAITTAPCRVKVWKVKGSTT